MRGEPLKPMKTLAAEMTDTVRNALTEQRAQVADVRYGRPGTILFEFQGQTFSAPEPTDVMPAIDSKGTNAEASRAWALKQVLNGNAKQRGTIDDYLRFLVS